MKEIYPNLYVGSSDDYHKLKEKYFIVQAAQRPYFVNLKRPDYELWYELDNKLILNLVDANDPRYIPKNLIDFTLEWIDNKLKEKPVMIHCNLGISRSPSIGFLYLIKYTTKFKELSLLDAVSKFRELYPKYNPNIGLAQFIQHYYKEYLE